VISFKTSDQGTYAKKDIMNHAVDHIIAALRAAREQKAISQRELSARSGVPQAKISRLENGTVDVQLSSLVSLARALDLEVELVPRKALPAIEAIIRSTERKDISAATTNEVSKLARALQGVRTPLVPRPIVEQTLNHLRMIQLFPLSADQLEVIQRFNDVLKQKPLEIDAATLDHHIKMINRIRNQLAHTPPPALPPKPAYSLDEEDDDNA
jgi:transcriptional regulator with XRE-family HTH domain